MEKFEGVANTTFVPLVARIEISKEFPDLFYDKKALELEPYLPDGAKKGSFEYTHIASVARYYNMDKIVLEFIKAHGKSNVIYLGAGLESACFRIVDQIGPHKARFYEIDLPEVIDTRRKMFGENEDEKLIGGDLFALSWEKEIEDKTLPTILVVSGVFQYFLEEDIVRFIQEVSEIFPGQEFVFDATSTKGLRFTNWFIKRTGNKSALMTFGVDDAKGFGKRVGAKLIEEILFYTELREKLRKRANWLSRYSMKNSDKGKKAIILRLRLKA
ncbi:MAG: class I SAM-dependent methyltransferase [Bacilli bacterium]|nr:class I SAM-dependent methyltransferase [Bacilli bacterium]